MTHLSIGQRLAAGFAAILLLAMTILAIGLWRLHETGRSTEAMMAQPLAKERLVNDWYATVNAGARRSMAIARSADPSLVEFFKEEMAASSAAATKYQKAIEALIEGPREEAMFKQIGEHRQQFLAVRAEINQLKTAAETEKALQVLDSKLVPATKAYLDGMQSFQALQRESIDAQARAVQALNDTGGHILLGLGLLTLMLGCVCAWIITRSISVPLQKAVAAAQRVASGDLSARLHSDARDETGVLLRALQEMQTQLVGLVSHVRGNAESVATASTEIAQGNLNLSQRTEQQAAALQQTAATMDQLSATVRHNADNAVQANTLASGASQIAAQGGVVVGEVVDTMRAINQSAKQISDIIAVIDGIAFQTNILALNAAVEAARAGEQGRGFAVVAGEVRSLAQRSAEAAKAIKTLITHSVEQVEQGTTLVDRAGGTMGEIVAAIQRVSAIVAEISSASSEQSDGVSQVGQAVSMMDQATQQNAALVEQSAAAAESLKQQACQLVQAVAVFKLARA